LTGVGFAVALHLLVTAVCDMAVVTWCAQAMYTLFSQRHLTENFFYR